MIDSEIDKTAAFAAIERLQAITWRPDTARLGSHVALMREYLRRSAIVAEALGNALNWPWYDAASLLTLPGIDPHRLPGYVTAEAKPQGPGPDADPLEAQMLALDWHVGSTGQAKSAYAWKSCLWYIRWESVKRHPALMPLNLPNLYDPLITFHERGGWFRPEQGYLDLDGYNLSFSSKYCAETAQKPPLVITPAALDELDEKGNPR